MSESVSKFHHLFILEVKRRLLKENVPRLKKCLSQLNEKEIWHRPNEETVSVGNLVLHLCGNVRQWVLSGLGNSKDDRQRQLEFDHPGPVPTSKLIRDLDSLMEEVDELLEKLTPTELISMKNVQGFEESGISILLHVVEHFSYHVGQMTYIVKATKNMDMQYYSGLDLDVTD